MSRDKLGAARRFIGWLLPGVTASWSVALAFSAFAYGWRNPHLTEMQVLQDIDEWWHYCWPLAALLTAVYLWSWREGFQSSGNPSL